MPADLYRLQISFINDLHRCYCLLTYKHVIFADLQTCYLLLTYKHVICCWPTCTNKLFVADLQTCCTVLVAVIHRCYLLLFNTFHLLLQTYMYILDVICCWPTVVVYKHDICCWPTQMSCTSSGATLESFRTAWNTGTSRSSGKVSCKEHGVNVYAWMCPPYSHHFCSFSRFNFRTGGQIGCWNKWKGIEFFFIVGCCTFYIGFYLLKVVLAGLF